MATMLKKYKCKIYAGYKIELDHWKSVKVSDPIIVSAHNRDQAVVHVRAKHVEPYLKTLKPSYRLENDYGQLIRMIPLELTKITASAMKEEVALRDLGAVSLFDTVIATEDGVRIERADELGTDGKLTAVTLADVCSNCGDDRTGKGSLVRGALVFCDDSCLDEWDQAYKDKREEDARH